MYDGDDLPGESVCYADQVIGGYLVDRQTYLDVNRFRKAERARLYAKRKSITSTDKHAFTRSITKNLKKSLADRHFKTIAIYWPIRGEPDLRPIMSELSMQGYTVLLPVVLAKNEPLIFRPWSQGCSMIRGIWRIPIPEIGEPHYPDVIISPLLGFDAGHFRLGNGGGYYDRTLAIMQHKPVLIGVGYEHAKIETIFPMPWDIPMDFIVTEKDTYGPRKSK